MGLTANQMLKVATAEIGYAEKSGATKFGQWWDKRHGTTAYAKAAWCDMFLGWCAFEAGGEDGLDIVGEFAFTPWHAAWFARNGRFGNTPKKGSIVFFDWSGTRNISAIDHVGIVIGVDGSGRVVTIEGNTANQVAKRYRTRGTIVGYGYPRYTKDSPANVVTTKPVSVKTPASASAAPYYPLPRSEWFAERAGGKAHNRGDAVKQIQRQLNKRGWKLAVDGIFGPATDHAVRVFQDHHGLTIDGAVGPLTWAALWNAPKA
ncbi:peptidoglycan-binding protein [Microbispora sp. NPDC049633]|uniref:peptidoglycan-binding protein n=1 Tax=Microbispora sp. NPDC049633 TaxID=3154355 RepID=UPI00344928B1